MTAGSVLCVLWQPHKVKGTGSCVCVRILSTIDDLNTVFVGLLDPTDGE